MQVYVSVGKYLHAEGVGTYIAHITYIEASSLAGSFFPAQIHQTHVAGYHIIVVFYIGSGIATLYSKHAVLCTGWFPKAG